MAATADSGAVDVSGAAVVGVVVAATASVANRLIGSVAGARYLSINRVAPIPTVNPRITTIKSRRLGICLRIPLRVTACRRWFGAADPLVWLLAEKEVGGRGQSWPTEDPPGWGAAVDNGAMTDQIEALLEELEAADPGAAPDISDRLVDLLGEALDPDPDGDD